MNELQRLILDLIKEIDAICRKYNITYYASGGTVIGAFRHGGFIPWDDDADIYMTRDNFEKFKKAFQIEQPEGRTLGCLADNLDYPGTLAHYRNNENTSFITRYHILNSCDAGVLVDIFILDPIDNNPIHWDNHIGKLRIYADLNFPFYTYTSCGDTQYLSLYFDYEKKLKKYGKKEINKQLEKELFSFPEEEATHYILRWGTLPHIFPKEMFQEPVYVKYEDFELPMPTLWYDYLVMLYGYNWNEVPSKPADEGHVAIISTQHRYTNYLIDSERFIDKDKSLKMYFKRKSLLIQREKLRRPFIEVFLDAKKQYIKKSQERYLEENHFDIDAMFNNKQYLQIIEAFHIFLSEQLSESFIGRMTHNLYHRFKNPILIPISDNDLEKLMYSLLYTSDINRLNKLLKLKNDNNQLDCRFMEIKDKLLKVHHILQLFYDKRYTDVLYEVTQLDYSLSNIERLKYVYLSSKLNLLMNLSNEEVSFLIEKSNKDNKGNWMKLYGDYLFHIHDNSYKKYYEKALCISNDGFILNELSAFFERPLDFHQRFESEISVINSNKQEVEARLLVELAKMLDSNNIDYCLIGDTLKYAYFENSLPNKDKPLEIAIKPEQVCKLLSVMKDNPHFETPVENTDILSHSFLYKSLEDYYLLVNHSGKVIRKNLYVRILILRKEPSNILKRKYFNFLNLAFRAYKKGKESRGYLVGWIITNLYSEKRLRRIIFENYLKMSLNNIANEYKVNKTKYSVTFFEEFSFLHFLNYNFKIPLNVEKMIQETEKSAVFKPSPFSNQFFTINKYLNNDDDQKILQDYLLNHMDEVKKYSKALKLNKKIKPLNKQAKLNWNILLRAEERFNLYLYYSEKKMKIISLYENGMFKELSEILSVYDQSVREFLKLGLGLCFDMEITNIYVNLLINNGDEKIAEKLLRLIPEEHKQKIEIYDIIK